MYEYYIKLSDARFAIMDYIGEQTVSKYASSAECKAARGGAEGAMYALENIPPADVAPRAEVDFLKKTIAENAQKALEVTLEEVENAKREAAREIFEEIESEIVAALNSNYRAIAEHQEKYGDNVNLNFLTACYAKNNALRGMEAFVEDLKKKYVEGKDDT